MNFKNMTLDELRTDLIVVAEKGYPFFISGTIYWFVMGGLSFFIENEKLLALCFLLATGSIFPLAIAISRLLKINILSNNPLGVLGGIIGGIQAFYIPVWVVIYLEKPELIPMAIGILASSHFLPYAWIYQSKIYLFLTILMALTAFIFGYVFIEQGFSLLPFLLAALYLLTALALKLETITYIKMREHKGLSN
ncbi:DUF7010 family protein [Neobacillus sp. NPDC058068]|uniref:DUF7010 family protein n=1 Tax=Neobacillus sp. NPDC058068 TaxID=3346325 RepID=UPI0036D869C3